MTARKGGEMHSELAEYLHVAGRLKLLKKTWKTCDFARASLQSAAPLATRVLPPRPGVAYAPL